MTLEMFRSYLVFVGGLAFGLGIVNLGRYYRTGKPSLYFGGACLAIGAYCLLLRADLPIRWVAGVAAAVAILLDMATRQRGPK